MLKSRIAHIIWIYSSLLAYTILNVKAQEIDNQLWINYALTVPVTTNFSYGGDAGFRGFISNKDWNQVLVRPTATYRWNRTFAAAGAVALFSTFNKDDDNLYEFRIQQDFNVNWPDLSLLELFYRLRIEERFFFYESLPNNFNIRVRLLAGLETQDFRLGEGKRPFYFQIMFEGFRTVADDSSYEVFVNQTRADFSFGHRLSNSFRYEIHYIRQSSRLFADDGLETSQNILRIRLFHRLPMKDN